MPNELFSSAYCSTAGPEVAEVEQLQRQREDPVAFEAPAHAGPTRSARRMSGSACRHLQHPVELLLGPFLLPLLVVEVLATTGGVGSDGLDVAVGVGLIQTFFHAGGITRSLMRVVSRSVTRRRRDRGRRIRGRGEPGAVRARELRYGEVACLARDQVRVWNGNHGESRTTRGNLIGGVTASSVPG